MRDVLSDVCEFDSDWYWQWSLLIVVVYCKLCVYKRLVDCFNWRCRVDIKTRGTWWSLHLPRYTGRKWGNVKGGKICREVGMDLNPCVNTAEINCVLIIELQAVSEIFNLSWRPDAFVWSYLEVLGFHYQAGGRTVVTKVLAISRQFCQRQIHLLITSFIFFFVMARQPPCEPWTPRFRGF